MNALTTLEHLKPQATLRGILPNKLVTVVSVQWFGTEALELTYKLADGHVANRLLYRSDETQLEIVEEGRPWSFDGDGYLFKLVSEAQRIHRAHLFDPLLAVHTSVIDPLPHQISAVYEEMLPRQPLRFLLADDPGAGKTIMTGLLIKELVARGDIQRCLIVCPGSLAEQWQEELDSKFQLPFEILTNDKIEASRSGNFFVETPLVIARLDKLSRDEDVQAQLSVPELDWDLIVCDEAHKMSATFFGGEIKYTKRYKLGQLLSSITRNLLLLTATPHNGKEEDFQLFLALLDGDRFEGKFRDGVHNVDVSDIMRRAVKEQLLTFEGRPLFPERIAHTVPYKLSDSEARLYAEVTKYVREEFNRAEKLSSGKRAGTVGFALTILQRRLASSPEAIYQSLKRRKERLESRLSELLLIQRGVGYQAVQSDLGLYLDEEQLEDLEDLPDSEFDEQQDEVLDQATAAVTVEELKVEIETLKDLETLALKVRRSGADSKWRELSSLLGEIFNSSNGTKRTNSKDPDKLVIFTEHRDTLRYLQERISSYLGRSDSVVTIHGGVGRQERLKIQELFRFDPDVKILVATDAAGEGINLQRSHLMVNYDLPWNPNRIEQRFGRIHRIGQHEVCYLWNLVAIETREGDVYNLLLRKLEQARSSLGGQVFDVLGKLNFEGKPLRDLLLEAIRHSESPEVKLRLETVIADALDVTHLRDLLDERALVSEAMGISQIFAIKEEMERAEAKRLQPSYIKSFFQGAFSYLGGVMREREPNRFEISNVPAQIRNRDRQIGTREPVLKRYERVAFEKSLLTPMSQVPAAFLAPGHPLLEAVTDLTLEQHRDLLRRGTILVDDSDPSTSPRLLFYLEHSLQDATSTASGRQRVISKQMLFVEVSENLEFHRINYAPYLDYRPLEEKDPSVREILARPEVSWVEGDLGNLVITYAIEEVVPKHLKEVQSFRLPLIDKTEAAVVERLTKEIHHWDYRSAQLNEDELRGKANARLNSIEARKRADELSARLEKRTRQLALERQISPLPPVVLGGVLIVPKGLLSEMSGIKEDPVSYQVDTDRQAVAAKARAIVIERETRLGNIATDREFERLGYDVESKIPTTGDLRFIEVKGRIAGAETITVTKNEILYSLNNPENFVLAIIEFYEDGSHKETYVKRPFRSEPDFAVTSLNYNIKELVSSGVLEDP